MDKVQQYHIAQKRLFERWKAKPAHGQIDHRNGVFVADGIVCPEQWFVQDIRPLFLLKEAYGGNADWDLIQDHLLTGDPIGKHVTWRRVTQWTQGLLNTSLNSICSFEEIEKKQSFGNEFLKHIAAMNIKKSGGKKESEDKDLAAYAQHDKEELYEQLQIIDPTVIVCGYTMDFLNIVMPEPVKEYTGQSPNLFYRTSLNGHDVLVLYYWHPSNQYPDIMNYYTLMCIYQQALKAGLG